MIEIKRLFDPELVKQDDYSKLKYFKDKVINHSRIRNAIEDVLLSANCSASNQIIHVVGPTKSGKTTLSRQFYKRFKEGFIDQQDADPGFIPIIGLNAPTPDPNTGRVEWKDCLSEILRQAGEQLADNKLWIPPKQFCLQSPFARPAVDATKLPILQRAAIEVLRQRKTQLLLINKAHNLFKLDDSRSSLPTLRMLGDLAQESGSKLVIVSNYDLVDIKNEAGEWLSRHNAIHLRRYDLRDAEDEEEFASNLAELLGHIPVEKIKIKLTLDTIGYFYTKSVGCIGILKDWLLTAFEHALKNPESIFDVDFIDQYSKPNKYLHKILMEALEGERKLLDIDASEITNLLEHGLPYAQSNSGVSSPSNNKTQTRRNTQSGKRRIGERLTLVRDPLGNSSSRKSA